MTRIGAIALVLAGAVALGCGWPETPRERADWFFGYGDEWIQDALGDVDAGDAGEEAAREVIEGHEAAVTAALETFFERHRELLRTLAGGAETEALLAREDALSEAHREALRRIGAMHAEVGEAVGEPTWRAARERMRERIDERLED